MSEERWRRLRAQYRARGIGPLFPDPDADLGHRQEDDTTMSEDDTTMPGERAIGCTRSTPWPTEFWVQTDKWGQPACGQHVAGVLRKALANGARAVVVDRDGIGRPCQVDGDPDVTPTQLT